MKASGGIGEVVNKELAAKKPAQGGLLDALMHKR